MTVMRLTAIALLVVFQSAFGLARAQGGDQTRLAWKGRIIEIAQHNKLTDGLPLMAARMASSYYYVGTCRGNRSDIDKRWLELTLLMFEDLDLKIPAQRAALEMFGYIASQNLGRATKDLCEFAKELANSPSL